jgi:hypothetical protein
MKKTLLLLITIISSTIYAQVGINTNTPDPSSILDIKSTNKGILIPRVSLKGTNDVTTIANPVLGLMVFNTTASDNGTPTDTSDDVIAKVFYYWDNVKWQQFVNYDNFVQKLNESAVPQIEVIASYAPQSAGTITTAFLSADRNVSGANIRQIMFDDTQFDPNKTFDKTTAIFTAQRDGVYSFDLNLLMKSYSNAVTGQYLQVAVSKPFTNFNLPPNKLDGTNDGTNNWNNASFAFLNRAASTATITPGSFPTNITLKGVQNMKKGEKVIFLTRFITPGTSTTATDNYTNDVETINYLRNKTSNIVITYYPVK